MTEYVDVRLADEKFLQELQNLTVRSISLVRESIAAGRIHLEPDNGLLQELQNYEPPTCPTCGKSSVTVYCTPLPDTEVRLLLRATGRSAYAGPCHRVNIGVDSPDETV